MINLTQEHLVLGRNIARIRIEYPITQELLAAAAGIHVRYLQKVEKGSPHVSVNVLICIRRALHCDWKDLLRGIS